MKRVTLYSKTGCTTCLKARHYLLEKGIHYTERDIFKHPFTETELRRLVANRPVKELFSFRSPSVKALGLADKAMTDDEMIQFMLQEPRLIRRPLVQIANAIEVGFSEEHLEAVLKVEAVLNV